MKEKQKSNYIYFKDDSYDTLMLGSSRVTFLNQNDFKNKKAFNYSFSYANPKNYKDYIEFAKLVNKNDFKYIVIGLDFFTTNKNLEDNINPEEVFDTVKTPFNRYKILFSIDTLKLSLENLKRSLLNKAAGRSYNRENIAFTTKIEESEVVKKVENIPLGDQLMDITKYEYDENYKSWLEDIKVSNPNSEFIVFTTPTTLPYFNKLFENNLKESYDRWLHESIDVFGKITHFMDKNSITQNYPKYFMDFHHIYPEYSSLIVDKLENIDSNSSPKDFGKLLKKENLDKYLNGIN